MGRDTRHLGPLPGAEHRVHLGELLEQGLPRALRQAPGDDQPPEPALAPEADEAGDRLLRLAHRALQEGTGVDDRDVRLAGIADGPEAGLHHQAQHLLGIHGVLGTAQGDEGQGRWWRGPHS